MNGQLAHTTQLLLSNPAAPFSVQKFYDALRAQGIAAAKGTIHAYLTGHRQQRARQPRLVADAGAHGCQPRRPLPFSHSCGCQPDCRRRPGRDLDPADDRGRGVRAGRVVPGAVRLFGQCDERWLCGSAVQ